FFKRNTGMTFVTFLNYYRINKARWLLMNENLPVSEVAFEAGFQSTKTFYRLFKQETQMSPLQYQKQYYEILQ
ncbi:MAG TPA: AraC family transcriptional regulator, partial [Firmicutes bacterium]|nr:AraC family transcriptional regulator [Bacillota bacterium]